jgi:hypothetical protein
MYIIFRSSAVPASFSDRTVFNVFTLGAEILAQNEVVLYSSEKLAAQTYSLYNRKDINYK